MGAAGPDQRNCGSTGQALVEFSLLFPVVLLIAMIGLDFGRTFAAWIGLQNASRLAANYASLHPDAWSIPGNATYKATYASLVTDDLQGLGCPVPNPVPDPTFPDGSTSLGSRVSVSLSCNLPLITPVMSDFFAPTGVAISGKSVFPVRGGIINAAGGAGSAPAASFTATPTSGTAPLAVNITNTTTGIVTNWSWDFGDGSPIVTTQNPGSHQYTTASITPYTITLVASNTNGSTSATATITVASSTGLVPDFTWTPTSPLSNQLMTFSGTATGGTGPYTWAWTWGDLTAGASAQAPTHTYTTSGTYSVTLTVTDSTNATATVTKSVTVASPNCTVPDFKNMSTDNVQAAWTAAGFKTNVDFDPRVPPSFKVTKQSVAAGTSLACDTGQIQVLDHA